MYAPSFITGSIYSPSGQGAYGPQTTDAALVNVFTDVSNTDSKGVIYSLVTSVIDASGAVVASTTSTGNLDAATGWARVSQSLTLTGTVNLWNPSSPYLYTVTSQLKTTGGSGGSTMDAVNTTIGIRRAVFSPDYGLLVSAPLLWLFAVGSTSIR